MNKTAARIMKLHDFISRHREDFDDFELEWFQRNIARMEDNFNYYPFVIREIYDILKLVDDKKNLYHRFYELVKELYDIRGKRILEVGAGVYPTLADRLCTEAGIVVCYDPRLTRSREDTPKLKLVRKDFKKNMSLADYDLVISLMPCKGAEAVCDACVEQDKDFIVGLCEGGPHGDYHDYFEDDIEWRSSIMSYTDVRLRRNGTGKILTKELDGCSYPYPIIYNSRK